MANRRRKYRVRLKNSESIRAALIKAGRQRVAARIIDLSRRGVAVQFEPWLEPVYALGEELELELKGGVIPEPIRLPCVVRRRSELSEGRFYGLEFTSLQALR